MFPSFHIKSSKTERMKNNIKRISRFFQYSKIFTFCESHFPWNIWVQSCQIVTPKTAPETQSGFQCTPKIPYQNLWNWRFWRCSKLENCKKCNNFLQQISTAKQSRFKGRGGYAFKLWKFSPRKKFWKHSCKKLIFCIFFVSHSHLTLPVYSYLCILNFFCHLCQFFF